MSSSASPMPSILPVSSADRPKALDLVFSDLDPEERQRQIEALDAPPTGNAFKEFLAGAYREGTLAGAGLVQVQPGRTAQVWLPRSTTPEPRPTSLKILHALSDQLKEAKVVLAQVLLESVSPAEEELLHDGGFAYLADLLYLVCPESEFPVDPPPSALQFETYNTADSSRLARLVKITYQDTKDCPTLNGLRQVEDVLEGYRASGVFDPGRWFLVRERDRDIGCLLLADHPAYNNVELVYMGVIPAARGHQWGRYIARFAQWQTGQLHRVRLVLAVDAANGPALQMYAAVGFQVWDRRRVYYRVFPPGKKLPSATC